MSGVSSSLIQLYWMFWRVVKWPKLRSYVRAMCAKLRICFGRKRAVWHVDAKHVGVQLHVQAVHEPQRPELVLGELAVEPSLHLAPKLRDALRDERVVEFVVAIHGNTR